MRKVILLLLLGLFLTSCANASTPDSQAFPDAADLPTLPPFRPMTIGSNLRCDT
ncbi:MAG: hypothetical protein WBB65_13120 [Anaerolineales bacterium]